MKTKHHPLQGKLLLARGKLQFNMPLARYTSWRVGGPADRIYIPTGLEDLAAFLHTLESTEQVYFIGLGSNLLVRDGGVRGTVVLIHNTLSDMGIVQGYIYAEAGVTCSKLAKFSARQHRHGAEFMAGIPGTVGGALAMNAGCHGTETWDKVAKVMTVDRQGIIHTRGKSEFTPTYRHVDMPANEWFLAAWFALAEGGESEAKQEIKTLLAKRLATQPLNLPNAGSVFRNPPGDFAARLIEACGLKGFTIGGAQVSEKHANFIVNLGNAMAADIEQLIVHVRETVKQQQGVELQQEVRVIGEAEHA